MDVPEAAPPPSAAPPPPSAAPSCAPPSAAPPAASTSTTTSSSAFAGVLEARAQASVSACEPLPGGAAAEAALVGAFQSLLGPYVPAARLLHFLRATRGKLHWAHNSYLRQLLSAPADRNGREEFDYRPPVSEAAVGEEEEEEEAAGEARCALAALSGPLLELVLQRLPDHTAVCAAAQACRALRRAAQSEAVWRRLFTASWGTTVFPTAPAGETSSSSSSGSGAPEATWRERFRDQHAFLRQRRCPRCGGSPAHGADADAPQQAPRAAPQPQPRRHQKLLPVLYGFPSPPLMAGHAEGRLILGGDHLLEGCAVWACTSVGCRAVFKAFPYSDLDKWVHLPAPPASVYTYEL